MDIDDRLEVRLVEARDLSESEGGECNPFATVRCGREFERTVVANSTSNPIWYGDRVIFTDLAEADVGHIIVKVFHKTMGAGTDLPLGQAAIELKTVMLSPGIETDEWYELSPQIGQENPATGGVRVELAYFLGDEGALFEDGESEFSDDDDDNEERRPNMLVGTLGRSRYLAMKNKEVVDAYVSISVEGHKHSTKVRRGESTTWNEAFKLPVSSGQAEVTIKAKDRGILQNRLIGEVKIPMVEVAVHGVTGFTKWCRLLGVDGTVDGEERGEVELFLSWVYDPRYARSLARLYSAAASMVALTGRKKQAAIVVETHKEEGGWMLAETEEHHVKLNQKEQTELDERRGASKMMAERRLTELEAALEHKMPHGDYQVQVHIIEMKDLKGEDLSGLSDPYARVKVLGRSKKTRVVKQVSGAVFDETLYFNLKGVSSSAVEESIVEVQVHDYDPFTSHAVIGRACFDVRDVHAREGHEYYRQWVGLIDTTNDEDRGYQGFLKLSITVLGAGDSQRAHDVEREYLDELDASMDEGGDAGGMVMTAPRIGIFNQVFLVVYVWEAEDLPKMNNGLFGGNGIEAYLRVDFAGSRAKTSSVQVSGRGNLAPVFHEELWIPVAEPLEARKITLGLWDYNTFSKDKAVAHEYLDYNDVERTESGKTTKDGSSMMASMILGGTYGGPRPRWHNLYGAPLGVQGKRGAFQNRYGDEASTYRGRVLISMQILTKPSVRESRTAHTKAFAFRARDGLKPTTAKYHLRSLILVGSEIPILRSRGMLSASKMRMVVCIGQHEMIFNWAANERGVVKWNQIDTLKYIDLPVTVEDIPDVCVYLERKNATASHRVCYARIPAARLLRDNFGGEPEWVQLTADKAGSKRAGGLAVRTNPGAVLLRLGLGLSDDALDPALAWHDNALIKKMEDTKAYQIRVYIYQARYLPSSDDNGLIDAYCKVRFNSHKARTKTKQKTTAPLWYETLIFDEVLPKDVGYAPDIVVHVWDEDTLAPNSPMAHLRIPLRECELLANDQMKPPRPKWRTLYDLNAEPLRGELLVCAVLIPKREIAEKFDRPDSIKPAMRMAWIEVTMVGVRQLKNNSHFRSPRQPYVTFDVPGGDEESGGSLRSRASSKPSGRDANFIEQKILPLELPEDTLFAPMMDLRVYDASIGLTTALQEPLLGACSIDLSTKMSWNDHGYIPPQMELFDDTAARMRQQEIEAASRARAEAEAAEDALDAKEEEEDEGNVGFSNGDADDEVYEEEDADGDLEQFELERRAHARGSGVDAGIGAFDMMTMADLPEIYEDVLFEEEMRLRQEEHEAKEKQEQGGRSYLDMLSARLAAAADTDALVGEKQYKLSELDLKFPTQWADADYLDERQWWVSEHRGLELENYLKTKPFETYTVYRGKYHTNPSKSTLRPVGIFKGVIRVLDSDPTYVDDGDPGDEFLSLKLLQPAVYTCRLYVTKALNLQPVDGRSCDPYLRVKLGSSVDDRPTTHVNKTLRPEFCEFFEFNTTLPGPATLKIQVKDWNLLYPIHELVGETKIDLEDRWFHREWQKLDLVKPGSSNQLKPIEIRNLTKETSSVSQGQLYMWLEIRKVQDARRDPPVELKPAEKRSYEIRVIIWQSKDVPMEMGDFYASCWIGDSKKQKTDVHWRCRSGRASWNWRLKFKVELPLASPELGRLNVQLWDQDVFKWNDVIGDTQLDLYKWMLMAYHENRSVNVFKIINDAIKRKDNEEQGLANDSDLEDSDDESVASGTSSQREDDEEKEEDEAEKEALQPGTAEDETKDEGRKKKEKKKKKEKEKDVDSDDESVNEDKIGKKIVEDADKDASYFIQQLREMVGLGDLDESAQWLKMQYTKRKKGAVRHINRGSIAISVEILPEEEAEVKPAGYGISNPNSNPVLPPRTGRLSFSYNPMYICTALLGPRLAMQICCCFVCILIAAAWFYLGMYYTNIYTFFEASGLVGTDDGIDDATVA